MITINLPYELRGINGIFVAPVNTISLDESFSSLVLCVQDELHNIIDLSRIENIYMKVKVGGAKTPYGLIIFILFMFWDIYKEHDKFTYEVLINPSDKESYEQYLQFDHQKEWEVLIIEDNQVLNIFKFRNNYNISEPIEELIDIGKYYPCINFTAAKCEYFRTYDIEELIEYDE